MVLLLDASVGGWPVWIIPALAVAGGAGAAVVVTHLMGQRRGGPAPAEPTESELEEREFLDPFVVGSASERRTAYRRPGNPVEVSLCEAESSEELLRGWVLNRSLGGLSLALHQPITLGTVLNIRPANAPLGAHWIQIEVRSCQQKGKNWVAGCRFIRTPNWNQLLLFG
jgi:hypothetical protein